MDDNDNAAAARRLSGVGYIEILDALHTHPAPRSYLEVGTQTGASLAVACCDTIAVDPRFEVAAGATANRRHSVFFQMTSDAEVVLGQTRTNRFATAVRGTRPTDRAVHPLPTTFRDGISD